MSIFDKGDRAATGTRPAKGSGGGKKKRKNTRIQNIRLYNISKIRKILTRMQKEIVTAGNASPEVNETLFLRAGKDRRERANSASVYARGLKVDALIQASNADDEEKALMIVLRISDHVDPSENEDKKVINKTLLVDDVLRWWTRDDWGKWDLHSTNENKRKKLLRNPDLNFEIDNDDFRAKVGEALNLLKAAIKNIS